MLLKFGVETQLSCGLYKHDRSDLRDMIVEDSAGVTTSFLRMVAAEL